MPSWWYVLFSTLELISTLERNLGLIDFKVRSNMKAICITMIIKTLLFQVFGRSVLISINHFEILYMQLCILLTLYLDIPLNFQ